MSGFEITGDEREQWIEPFRAMVALSHSDAKIADYHVSVGDASVGLATVRYGARRPAAWPEVPAWLFTIGKSIGSPPGVAP